MSYPGSKAQAGVWQRIIGQMPEHSVYVEPFFGLWARPWTGPRTVRNNTDYRAGCWCGQITPAAFSFWGRAVKGQRGTRAEKRNVALWAQPRC